MYTRTCPICSNTVTHTSKYNRNRLLNNPCKACSPQVLKSQVANFKNVCLICKVEVYVKYQYRVSNNWKCQSCRHKVDKICVICNSNYQSRKYDKSQTCSDKCKFTMIARNMSGDSSVTNLSQIEEYRVTRKVIKNQSGKNNGMYGKSHSLEAKRKMRLKRTQKFMATGTTPRVNPTACTAIDNLGTELGYKFQHGMNGGEVYLEKLGYYLDGYDATNNVVVEYDEPHHQTEKWKAKDLIRQQEIIQSLNCKFIRLVENIDGSITKTIIK